VSVIHTIIIKWVNKLICITGRSCQLSHILDRSVVAGF